MAFVEPSRLAYSYTTPWDTIHADELKPTLERRDRAPTPVKIQRDSSPPNCLRRSAFRCRDGFKSQAPFSGGDVTELTHEPDAKEQGVPAERYVYRRRALLAIVRTS